VKETPEMEHIYTYELVPGLSQMKPAKKAFIPTRQSLLSRLKDWNDQESWRTFFNTYWKLIYNAAIRRGLTDAEAQDVVQETVITVSKNMPNFVYNPAKGTFKTWLMRQIGWQIANQFRKRLPIERAERWAETSTGTAKVEDLPDETVSPLDSLWDEEWERNILEAAMHRVKAKVDGKQYQIFDLYVRQKWPVAKIAKDLKISATRVYLAKHRVGKLIQQEVEVLKTKPL
jgi:RNA polymerase sigma factor (sigma-70 family)